MSDSTQIKPLGLATSMVAGAAVGAVVPSITSKVKNFVANSPKADAFVKSVAEKATKATSKVKNTAGKVAEKTKLDKAAEAVKTQASKFVTNVKESKIFNKIKDSKVTAFVKDAAVKVGQFLKKPAVIGALVGALAYITYKLIKQHQENKAFEEV